MQRDVRAFINACEICQQFKVSQKGIAGSMGTTITTQPWEVVSSDIVGPITRSSEGYTHFVVFHDKFTKWIEVVPLRKPTSSSIIKAFRERVLLRFGCPKNLISDNGSQYTSNDFTNMLKSYGITHLRIPPYSPQCNPTERVNRVIKTMIAQFIEKTQRSWAKYLPELVFAYNSARQDSTQFSPAYLNYGRELEQPTSLRKSLEAHGPNQQPDREIALARLQDTMDLVKVNLAKAFTSQKKHFDKSRRNWKPELGEEVRVRTHHLSKASDGINAKLMPKFSTICKVTKIISPTRFEVMNNRGERMHVHLKDLKENN